MKKVIAIAVFGLLGAAWYVHSRRAVANEPERETYVTAMAERGDISITVSASGRIEPERSVEIKSKASGEVIEVLADVSDEVKQGMLLFRLDPIDEQRSVAKLAANLAMSRAKLEQTKLRVSAAEAKLKADTIKANADLDSAKAEHAEYVARLRRAQQLHEQRVISREELDTATTQGAQAQSSLASAQVAIENLAVQAMELDITRQEIHIAEAQVETDMVALADAEQRLKETEVFAPIDGVVSERTIQEGVIVASGVSNVGGGTTAMNLIDLSRIYAIAAVDESDISGVAPGVPAVITADAYKNKEFRGRVVRVATTGEVESNVVTFDVKVEVESRNKSLLKPEMTTNVTFVVDQRQDVVTVPVGAVVRRAVEVDRAAGPEASSGGRSQAGPRSGSSSGSGRPGGPVIDYSRRESFVTVLHPGGRREDRKVETGITDGNLIEIVSGLEAGETVIIQTEGTESRWEGRRPGPPPPRM